MTTNTSVPTQGKTTAPVWVVRAGKNGEDESTVLEEGVVIMDFREMPNLSDISENAEKITRMVEKIYGKTGHLASQLVRFTCHIKENHIIVLPLKTRSRQIAIGLVTGPYKYLEIDGISRHTRAVKWVRADVSRSEIGQDLLYSIGSNLTVFRVKRNDADRRFAAIMDRERDPEKGSDDVVDVDTPTNEESPEQNPPDIADVAESQILDRLQKRFPGHGLARLVNEILKAEGYFTQLSAEGPDSGVDILAGRGAMGFDQPRICVQVKATEKATEEAVFSQLIGTMQRFEAHQGLLVSWGGFTKAAERAARRQYFRVRLWRAKDLLEALYRTYEKLPEEIQAEIPMKRVWALVPD